VLTSSKCSMCEGNCIPVHLVVTKCFYSRILTERNTENTFIQNLLENLNIQSDFVSYLFSWQFRK